MHLDAFLAGEGVQGVANGSIKPPRHYEDFIPEEVPIQPDNSSHATASHQAQAKAKEIEMRNKEAREAWETEKKDYYSSLERWQQKDGRARFAILSSIDESLVFTVQHCKTSKEMLNLLGGLFREHGLVQRCTVWTDFVQFRFDSSSSVMAFT